MLPIVDTSVQKLDKYRQVIPDKMFNEIKDLAADLSGLKVTMINATPRGRRCRQRF